jgi:hypothetical protein
VFAMHLFFGNFLPTHSNKKGFLLTEFVNFCLLCRKIPYQDFFGVFLKYKLRCTQNGNSCEVLGYYNSHSEGYCFVGHDAV